MTPGLRMGLKVIGLTLLYLACLAPLVLLVDVLDAGIGTGKKAFSLLSLLLPLSLAGASAQAFASARVDGEWDLDSLLGYSPGSRLAPLLALSIVGAGVILFAAGRGPSLWLEQSESRLWSLPAPVDAGASLWLDEEGWARPDLSYWMGAPHSLTLSALWGRMKAKPPSGARTGGDRAEFVRRMGWSMALPLAVVFGARAGQLWGRKRREPGSQVLWAVLSASAAQLLWMLVVLLLAAYLSSTM